MARFAGRGAQSKDAPADGLLFSISTFRRVELKGCFTARLREPPDQARKLVATARETGDRFEAPYVLALRCGLREDEVLGLKWDDIDLSGTTATLHVRRTLSQTRTGHIFEKPKNVKGRSVKCSRKATEALKRRRARQNEERLGMGSLWQDNISYSRPSRAPP